MQVYTIIEYVIDTNRPDYRRVISHNSYFDRDEAEIERNKLINRWDAPLTIENGYFDDDVIDGESKFDLVESKLITPHRIISEDVPTYNLF